MAFDITNVYTASGALVFDHHHPVDASAGPVTVTLPQGYSDDSLSVEKVDATVNPVVISGNIRGGGASMSLTLGREAITFISDRSGVWWPVTGHKTLSSLKTFISASAGAAAAMRGTVATLRRGNRSACIALIGDSTGDGKEVGTATLVDEWAQVFTKRLARDYPAYTLLERRWNDTNQSYDQPIVQQTGTANSGADRHAVFNKTSPGPGALQYAGTAVTTNIDIRARIAPNSWTPSSDSTVAAKWESTGNQRSWLLLLRTGGGLGFNWSAAGTAGAGQQNSTVTLPSVGAIAGQPMWVRVTLTLDNGATGNDVKFYYGTDGTTWTQLGTTVTTAGVTTLFGGTANYQIGAFSTGLTSPFDGKLHWIEVHSGIVAAGVNGGSVVPPLPDDWEYYTTGETTVSLGGAPVLMFLNGSQSGQNVAYFDNATRRPIVHHPHGQSVLIINTGHNDGTQSRATWLGAYNTMVTNIKALLPYVPILAMAQNPVGLGGTFNNTAQGIELRAARGAILQQWATSQAGVHTFDAWPMLTAADTIDQLHPTTGTGSGAEKWGLGLYTQIGT